MHSFVVSWFKSLKYQKNMFAVIIYFLLTSSKLELQIIHEPDGSGCGPESRDFPETLDSRIEIGKDERAVSLARRNRADFENDFGDDTESSFGPEDEVMHVRASRNARNHAVFFDHALFERKIRVRTQEVGNEHLFLNPWKGHRRLCPTDSRSVNLP